MNGNSHMKETIAGAKTGDLKVKVLTAALTVDTETWGDMAPYVKLDIGGRFKETKVGNIKKGEMNPNWDGQIVSLAVHSENSMTLQIWDDDKMDDDLIGECEIDLTQIKTGVVKK